ncbi:MAG: tRNA dihydrouridine(20/20a) synthase DusA [Cyanobacteria bacterium RI_101]|nr:tRNA dihydrouridine(20/20a) synthase DusA [Cyanobacteria bacterium RI_101]
MVKIIPLSVAPMMDYTDRHFRAVLRRLTRRTLLYTEMITAQAILRGDRAKLLDFDPMEKPLVLQLGGDDPQSLAQCAQIGADWGYDQINLNVGCPSDRVQNGRFGACLMARPERVAECAAAMMAQVSLPVTVKHRVGVDDQDSYENLRRFVETVAQGGCRHFIVHARKAWLQGLSPKENRTIPPLRYDFVYRLKQDFPHLAIEINGGIDNLTDVQAHLTQTDGAMIGRAAYEDPYLFAAADRVIFHSAEPSPSRRAVVEALIPYCESHLAQGGRLHSVSRHLLNLFKGQPGSRRWKRYLSEQVPQPGAGPEVLLRALAQIDYPED